MLVHVDLEGLWFCHIEEIKALISLKVKPLEDLVPFNVEEVEENILAIKFIPVLSIFGNIVSSINESSVGNKQNCVKWSEIAKQIL